MKKLTIDQWIRKGDLHKYDIDFLIFWCVVVIAAIFFCFALFNSASNSLEADQCNSVSKYSFEYNNELYGCDTLKDMKGTFSFIGGCLIVVLIILLVILNRIWGKTRPINNKLREFHLNDYKNYLDELSVEEALNKELKLAKEGKL